MEEAKEIYHHLGDCPQCQDYCRVGRLISREMLPAYAEQMSVADQVYQYINNPASAWFAKQRQSLRQFPENIELGLALVRYRAEQKAPAFLFSFKGKVFRATPPPHRRMNSIPLIGTVLVLLLVSVLMVIVLAYTLAGRHSNTGAKPKMVLTTATAQSRITLPSLPTATPTPLPGSSLGASAPRLQLCKASTDRGPYRVGICGYNFHPGDKLELIVYSRNYGQSRPYRTLTVNARGQFQTFLAITPCREAIKGIYVQDLTNSSVNPPPLTNIPIGRCMASSS